jgi:hypothetical protein
VADEWQRYIDDSDVVEVVNEILYALINLFFTINTIKEAAFFSRFG